MRTVAQSSFRFRCWNAFYGSLARQPTIECTRFRNRLRAVSTSLLDGVVVAELNRTARVVGILATSGRFSTTILRTALHETFAIEPTRLVHDAIVQVPARSVETDFRSMPSPRAVSRLVVPSRSKSTCDWNGCQAARRNEMNRALRSSQGFFWLVFASFHTS